MIKRLVLPDCRFLDLRQSRRAETLLLIHTRLQAGLPWFPRFAPDHTRSPVAHPTTILRQYVPDAEDAGQSDLREYGTLVVPAAKVLTAGDTCD